MQLEFSLPRHRCLYLQTNFDALCEFQLQPSAQFRPVFTLPSWRSRSCRGIGTLFRYYVLRNVSTFDCHIDPFALPLLEI